MSDDTVEAKCYNCGRVLSSRNDGIVIVGQIHVPRITTDGDPTGGLLGFGSRPDAVYGCCWNCFHSAVFYDSRVPAFISSQYSLRESI